MTEFVFDLIIFCLCMGLAIGTVMNNIPAGLAIGIGAIVIYFAYKAIKKIIKG